MSNKTVYRWLKFYDYTVEKTEGGNRFRKNPSPKSSIRTRLYKLIANIDK